jgi:hypothetical protein
MRRTVRTVGPLGVGQKIKRRDANKYGEEKEKSKGRAVEVGNRNALKAGISLRYGGIKNVRSKGMKLYML